MAQQLTVKLPDETNRSYMITVERGLLAKIKESPADFGLDGQVVIISNSTVAPLYADTLAASLPHAQVAIMQDGEQYKTLASVHQLYDQLLEYKADRKTTVLALGGGVVGDTAGFVAATYMRGIRLVQMPTTLLAMVDSSVGGKVGVDLPQGKNLVGAFKQPDSVLIDPDVLATLPPEQWRAGMAEVLKHGLIADEGLLNPELHQPERAEELVCRAVQVKIDVVEADPYEHGIRAYLNLGHTFGHAIEQVTHYEWLHGYAVGVGLLAAAKLSQALGMIGDDLVEQVDTVLAETGLPRSIGHLDPAALWDAMLTDKKWQSGRSRFVLLNGLCLPTIVQDVERALVLDVLEALRS